MNKQDSPTQTTPIWYAIHGNHLHSYRFEEEARNFAAEFGDGKYYSSYDVLGALRERKPSVKVVLAAIELLTAQGEEAKKGAYNGLRRAVTDFGKEVLADLNAGKLDGTMEPSRLAAMKERVELEGLVDKAVANIDRRVRVIASRPEKGQTEITGLIGREFEITAYDPITDHVQVQAPEEFGGIVMLGPDEYVFADEVGSPTPPNIAPTTDKLRD